MDNNWIVENLTNAFGVWNSKMTEMWSLLTESPQTFKGGTIWQTIVTINGGMQAIGYGLLVLFFAIGIFRSASSFRDFRRPEHLLRALLSTLCWQSWVSPTAWICWSMYLMCSAALWQRRRAVSAA